MSGPRTTVEEQMLTRTVLALLGTAALFATVSTGHAQPSVILGSGNAGISSINVTVTGTTIRVEETWSSVAQGVLEFRGLDAGTDYTVQKVITNNSGTAWTRLANELLDPAGQSNDAQDVLPYPAFVPPGFTTSNDADGLSFAQGSGLPRTSTVFASVVADELSDVRDFLDFFNGTVPPGGIDNFMTFGLRDNLTTGNQPFLLVQRPNQFSSPVPEPGSLALLALALAVLGLVVRSRSPHRLHDAINRNQTTQVQLS
jgi:hypothetical protein